MNTKAEIITIGDELLIGQVIDTNSAWIAQQLNQIGIDVCQITSIHDDKNQIVNSLDLAFSRADLIIVTGGLGPTKDDITKQTISNYFKSGLVRNEKVLAHISNLLEKRGITLNELNIRQADIPEQCEVLNNSLGTAPGMWFLEREKVFVFLPGVPFEMKQIVTGELLPKLTRQFKTQAIVHKTLMLQGIAESMLAQQIEAWENQLSSKIKLAYLPSPGIIRLRLSAKGEDKETLTSLINLEIEKLLPLIGPWYYADNDEPLEITVGKLLKNNNLTLATAESCTGGKIASLITSVAGSSEYYKGTVVAYSNDIKTSILRVPSEKIDSFGAVSQQVVEEMVQNTIRLFDVDYAVATSGIAGPDGGTPEKPVGTIWIAVASKNVVKSRKLSLGDNNRERNIQRTSISALNELRLLILQNLNK